MLKRRTFTSEIREFLIILSIFGLWPSGHTSKYRFFFAIYSILSMLLAVFICISALFILRIFEDSTLSVAVAYSFVLSGLFAHSVIIAQAFFYRNEQQRLVTKFAYVDELLQKKLRVNLSYDKEKRQILIRILAISFTLFAIKIAFFGHLYLRNAFQLQALGFWLHCMYSVFIMRLRCLQVLVFVLLLRSRINILNTKVKEILMTHNRHLGLSSTRWTSASDGKEVIFLLDVSTKFHSTYDRLLYIKQIYGELYEICEWMNMTFGWSLLAIVTQCFVEFTSVSYWIFLALEQPVSDVQDAIDSSALLVSIVIILFSMAYFCSDCSRNARFLGSYLHRINREKENEPQNDLIREFSLQLIHEPMVITANGFFNIDFDLLGSMVAAIITYLVILIQFELSDKEIRTLSVNATSMLPN